MNLQIRVSLDGKKAISSRIDSFKDDFVRESTLAIRNKAIAHSPRDSGALPRLPLDDYRKNDPPLQEAWETDTENPKRSVIFNNTPYLKFLLDGNHANSPDGLIRPKKGHIFHFKNRWTGEEIFATSVRPIDPNAIGKRYTSRPYSFRKDIIERAMREGSQDAIAAMEGKAKWRGILAIRLTQQ